MARALEERAVRLLVCLGGSATNDGGVGMASALGYHFLDGAGDEIEPVGAALPRLDRIDASHVHPGLASVSVTGACDVDNPLTGPEGAAAVYGPQKGATPEQVAALDAALGGWGALVDPAAVDLPGAPLWLEGDPTRLAQVVANVLNNAIKYTPPGGHIAVRADAQGDTAVLDVQDDGIGIPPQQAGRMFDLFVQGPQAHVNAHGGLGIGLTLVRQLVEMHGGRVEAKSEGPGQGSEFIVRLPAERGL